MLSVVLRGVRHVSLAALAGLAAASAMACASVGAVPRPFPSPDWKTPKSTPEVPRAPVPVAPGVTASAPDSATADNAPANAAGSLTAHRYDGRAVAEFALGFRGVPYRPGGADPAGFDCSGLVQYVLAQYGPLSAPGRAASGRRQASTVGDRQAICSSSDGRSRISRIAIAIGEGRFVHAQNPPASSAWKRSPSAHAGDRATSAPGVQ